MVLTLHITSALASILLSSLSLFSPSIIRFAFSGITVGFTLVSGVALAVQRHADPAGACIAGTVYLTGVGLALYVALRKYSAARISVRA